MFIMPQRQQTMREYIVNVLGLFQLSFGHLLPFAIIVSILIDAPTISSVLWHHNILQSPILAFAFALIEITLFVLFFAFSMHQVWGTIHNRRRAIEVSTVFVAARWIRLVAVPVAVLLFVIAYLLLSHQFGIDWSFLAQHVDDKMGIQHSRLWLVMLELFCLYYVLIRSMWVIGFIVVKDYSLSEALQSSWQLSQGRVIKTASWILALLLVTIPIHLLLLYLADVDNSVLDIVADLMVSAVIYILFSVAYALYFFDMQLPEN